MNLSPEALLAQSSFLRRLAQSLLFDEHEVDEVVQQTWLAALKQHPQNAASLRPWLRTTLRNFIFQKYRGDTRREQREEASARAERLPSTSEIVEREESRRELVELVLKLEEPYRSVILLRYFEERSAREIAKQLNEPLETVRTRIKRGLDRLREQLDQKQNGNRRAWCLHLIPLALPRGKVALLGSTAGILWLTASSVVFISAVVLWYGNFFSSSKISTSELHFTATDKKEKPIPSTAPSSENEIRVEIPQDRDKTAYGSSEFTPSRQSKKFPSEISDLRGLVIDEEGNPIANAEIQLTAGKFSDSSTEQRLSLSSIKNTKFFSAADGSFLYSKQQLRNDLTKELQETYEYGEYSLALEGTAANHLPGHSESLDFANTNPIEIILFRARPVSGKVFEAKSQRGISQALVSVALISPTQNPRNRNSLTTRTRTVITESDGSFFIPLAPLGELWLEAKKEGYEIGRAALRVEKEGLTSQANIELHIANEALRVRLLDLQGNSLLSSVENASQNADCVWGKFELSVFESSVANQCKGLGENPEFWALHDAPFAKGGQFHWLEKIFTFELDPGWKLENSLLVLFLNGEPIASQKILSVGEKTWDFSFDPQSLKEKVCSVQVRAIDAQNQMPISEITLRAYRREHRNFQTLRPEPCTNANTSFILLSRPGIYDIGVQARGYACGFLEGIEFQPGIELAPLSIQLNPGAQIRGKVESSAAMTVYDAKGRDVGSPHSDREGNFIFGGLAPGRYRFESQYGGLLGEVDAVPGKVNEVVFETPKSTQVFFRVVDKRSQSSGPWLISLKGLDENHAEAFFSLGRIGFVEKIRKPPTVSISTPFITLPSGFYRCQFIGVGAKLFERDLDLRQTPTEAVEILVED